MGHRRSQGSSPRARPRPNLWGTGREPAFSFSGSASQRTPPTAPDSPVSLSSAQTQPMCPAGLSIIERSLRIRHGGPALPPGVGPRRSAPSVRSGSSAVRDGRRTSARRRDRDSRRLGPGDGVGGRNEMKSMIPPLSLYARGMSIYCNLFEG